MIISTSEAKKWLAANTKDLDNYDLQTYLRLVKFKGFVPGQMYLMKYDPKHKMTLEYYDVFPLFFYVKPVRGGFYGVNLHYVRPDLRSKLLESMVSLMGLEQIHSDQQILTMNYEIISHFTKLGLAKASIKHYLNRKISRLKIVPSSEWNNVSQLPLALFDSQTQQVSEMQVWKDTIKRAKDARK